MQLSNIDLYNLYTDEFGKWIHALFGASWELLEDNLSLLKYVILLLINK
jgi:hypothetical protein